MSQALPSLAGVCGWPIHHSLSPLIHNYWLKEMGPRGAYVHFAVRPDEALRAFRSLKKTSISGVNVTIPLKETAFEAADERTPDAQKLGVANCLYKRNGKLIAHNTDMEGFAAPLLRAVGPRVIMNKPVLVIGTGGASRAVLGALLAMGSPEIRLCGRTDKTAETRILDIDVPNLYAVPWAERNKAVSGAGIIINATSAGMAGKPALDINLDKANDDVLIYDLVYTPLETPFIKQAKERSLPYLGGLEMLIAQARPSFKLFYGQTPPDDLDPTAILLDALGVSS